MKNSLCHDTIEVFGFKISNAFEKELELSTKDLEEEKTC
ncbi:hypothetical protein EW15_1736 [Prochlorococcus sp. MIT 0801]|nr:hypothetical protein EW15_1736 [Prochlorococcus sp. MIT 0801]